MARQSAYDVVVIGSGPGGEGAAMKSVKAGLSTAVVESFREVGGACTHRGTIPSKALRQAVQQLAEFRRNPWYKRAAARFSVDFPDLLKEADRVMSAQVRLRTSFYERNGVKILEGRAAFGGKNEIRVEHPEHGALVLKAANVVLAMGSRPYRPPEVDFSHPRVLDSDKVLGLKETPASIVIFGAGVVGCEYASIFRSLGSKVTLVNTREKLLTFLDDEIIDALSYHLRDQGVILLHNEEHAKVEADEKGVSLHLKSGKKIRAECLLWANGRTGNTDGMGLESLGVKLDSRGNVQVDENYRTAAPHVFAVGDVVGFPALASAAYDQGRFAATQIVEGRCDERLARDIPAGIYTLPEISSVGRTERELTAAKVPYEVGHAFFRSLARAQLMGETVGMLKLLFHRDTLEILGVHCFGSQAAEIIHIGQARIPRRPATPALLHHHLQLSHHGRSLPRRRAPTLQRLKGIAPDRNHFSPGESLERIPGTNMEGV